MNAKEFHRAYHEIRNGSDAFFRHPFCRNVIYSSGVSECADAGCYWLVDVMATDVRAAFKPGWGNLAVVRVQVSPDSTAILEATFEDGENPPAYSRDIDFTTLPVGEWVFFMAFDGQQFTIYLPSEH